MPLTFREYARSLGHIVSQTDTIFAHKKQLLSVLFPLPDSILVTLFTYTRPSLFPSLLLMANNLSLNFLSIYSS